MPLDFIRYVESGIERQRLGSGDWLTPATVHGLTAIDFVTLPPERREDLFQLVNQFRSIATAPPVGAAQAQEARTALEGIGAILQPYLSDDSRQICNAIWRVWENEKDRIPTFDYEIEESWTGSPIVWVWLILRDTEDIEAPATRELLSRVRMAIHLEFETAGIGRWPNVGVRTESDVRELVARATA